jgi:2-dehydropantoate 2-reductase
VIIAVKNYDLAAAASDIQRALGDRPAILAMQNGLVNKEILPRYFSKVVYCVAPYNAFIESPGVIGYQSKGPIILGAWEKGHERELGDFADILNRGGIHPAVTKRYPDAVHTKLVMNLSNSFITAIGYKYFDIPDSSMKYLAKLYTRMILEGIRVVKAAGYREFRMKKAPAWGFISLVEKLPRQISNRIFASKLKDLFVPSMGQDILQRGKRISELESINGALIELADKYGIDIPINRAVYQYCREAFPKPQFTPLDLRDLWDRVYGKA